MFIFTLGYVSYVHLNTKHWKFDIDVKWKSILFTKRGCQVFQHHSGNNDFCYNVISFVILI
jgi:hypothetical protein